MVISGRPVASWPRGSRAMDRRAGACSRAARARLPAHVTNRHRQRRTITVLALRALSAGRWRGACARTLCTSSAKPHLVRCCLPCLPRPSDSWRGGAMNPGVSSVCGLRRTRLDLSDDARAARAHLNANVGWCRLLASAGGRGGGAIGSSSSRWVAWAAPAVLDQDLDGSWQGRSLITTWRPSSPRAGLRTGALALPFRAADPFHYTVADGAGRYSSAAAAEERGDASSSGR